MAERSPKGSIILEIMIILAALLLLAILLVPNKIWEEEERVTQQCRSNMVAMYEAQKFYYRTNGIYTDSLYKVLAFVQSDSGLQERQSIVSLTRSLLQVIDNILSINSIAQISNLSKAANEITGDLIGNERYFRKYEDLHRSGEEINRDMIQFDSSLTFPNFCRAKLFVDSLRNLRDKISDYPLQNGILHGLEYVDSIKTYFPLIELDQVNEFWSAEYSKIFDFISDIRKTDIVKVSSVADRLKKFIDRINTSLKNIENTPLAEDENELLSQAQNLKELHQKFIAPEFFILTKRYGLTSLNETDSILIHLTQNQFTCPDNNQTYLIDTTGRGRLVVECPNLLDKFHQRFMENVDPIRDLPLFTQIDKLDSVFAQTRAVLNENRKVVRRNTDALLAVKELLAEMDGISSVFFYKYVHEIKDFIDLLNQEKKLSVLKPRIEEILNPMDTLATRMETGNLNDLTEKLQYFQEKLQQLDSLAATLRLSSRLRSQLQSGAEAFAPAFDVVEEIKQGFSASYAEALRGASDKLEQNLLQALEGEKETMYVIFSKKHINHGYILNGEKSWEAQ
ncbi:MAG: hypothetical protein Kow0042_12460 [Calditrichia bacterium]